MTAPRHINSNQPFRATAKEYWLKGWAVVPLPERRKKSPPGPDDGPQYKSFTGRKGTVPTEDDIEAWLADSHFERGNIAIRAGRTVEIAGKLYEAIGIDVDNYDKKTGGLQLRKLEKKYGPLPGTYTSSARSDSVSGIRWFLVPHGYEYMGKPRLAGQKACDSIEIVQKVHRYGLVFPSWHPETKGQYYWYDRGQAPDGIHFASSIPRVEQLAHLPDSWWKFLTRNGTEAEDNVPMDMDSEPSELRAWAKANFVDGLEICKTTQIALDNHIDKVENAADHHDPLVNAHWNLYSLGAEGHCGWQASVMVIDNVWLDRVAEDKSRSLTEAKFEMARSRVGTLRKLKGQYDEYKERKLQFIEKVDPCLTARPARAKPPTTAGGQPPRPPAVTPNPNAGNSASWERNEDGNAEHFLALFGENVRYVVNHADGAGRWLVFKDSEKRWVVDSKDTLVRNMFREVKRRQILDAIQMLANATAAGNQGAEREAKAWIKWAAESGNKSRVGNSLSQATTYPGVALLYEELDSNTMLLPVANGVLQFYTRDDRLAGKPAFEFLEDSTDVKTLLLTQNTRVPYIPFKTQRKHADPQVREDYKRFTGYMKMFLKDHLSQEAWDYTLKLLGLSILGVNMKKAIFLVGIRDTGKSTFQNMMNACLGDLSIWREPSIFEDTPFKPALAEALSRRVAMVGELGEKHMDASLFKRITGGDEVSCNLKNVNKPVTLRARCTVISGCNSAPDVPHVDDATKERFVVIPFRHQVTRSEKDPNAQDELMKHCKVPLLALLVESCSVAIEEGVQQIPAELQVETADFVNSLSEMSDFVNDCLVKAPAALWDKYARNDQTDPRDPKPKWPSELCVGDRTLYKQYEVYCGQNRIERLSKPKFTRRMKEAGLVQDGSFNSEKERRWLGVTFTKGIQRTHHGESD